MRRRNLARGAFRSAIGQGVNASNFRLAIIGQPFGRRPVRGSARHSVLCFGQLPWFMRPSGLGA